MSWKLHCVGVGSAFTDERYWQSNFMVESASGKKLLLDCGGDARHALRDYGINNGNVGAEIDGIYVSHLHGDHIHGLEWLGFCTYFNPASPKPKLFCVDELMPVLWEKSLRGGLGSVQGKQCTLTDYFAGQPVKINDSFFWEGIRFTPVQTVHVRDGMGIVPSYGLMIQEKGGGRPWVDKVGPKPFVDPDSARVAPPFSPNTAVFLTTDTQFCPQDIPDFYRAADLILHDCETTTFKSGVHSHYSDLATLPDEVRAKMWLYHYQPDPDNFDPVGDGFKGFLERKQVLEFDG